MKGFILVGETAVNMRHVIAISFKPNNRVFVHLDNGEMVEGVLKHGF